MRALYDQIILLLSTPLYVLIIGAEFLISHLRGRKILLPGKIPFKISLLSMFTGLTDLAMRGVTLIVLTFFFSLSFFKWPHSIAYWIILLLLVDLMHYWLHRLGIIADFSGRACEPSQHLSIIISA